MVSVMHTIRAGSGDSPGRVVAPRLPCRLTTCGDSALPTRFMNAAMASRLTGSVGQYSVAEVQPVVTARFFSHSTFGQNGLVLSTSVKPAQGSADALSAATANATAIMKRNVLDMVGPLFLETAVVPESRGSGAVGDARRGDLNLESTMKPTARCVGRRQTDLLSPAVYTLSIGAGWPGRARADPVGRRPASQCMVDRRTRAGPPGVDDMCPAAAALRDRFGKADAPEHAPLVQLQANLVQQRHGDPAVEERPIGMRALFAGMAELEVFVPGHDQARRLQPSVGSIARPSIQRRMVDHPRAHRIEFDVAHAGQQVAFRLHQTGPIATLEQRPRAPAILVHPSHVAAADAVHERRDRARPIARHEQMDVVGHQRVGVDRATKAGGRVGQQAQIACGSRRSRRTAADDRPRGRRRVAGRREFRDAADGTWASPGRHGRCRECSPRTTRWRHQPLGRWMRPPRRAIMAEDGRASSDRPSDPLRLNST